MGECVEKEVVVPSGLEHFVTDAKGARGCLEDVDGDLAEGGEVLGRVIGAGTTGVSANSTSRTQCRLFSTPQWARTTLSILLAESGRESRK
jgi:hypothetical protein